MHCVGRKSVQTWCVLLHSKITVTPGGSLTLERGMGMCRGHDPLFWGQSRLPSLPIYRQCAALVTPFSIFRKFLDFQPWFGQNSSSLDPNFCSQDPQFSRKIRSLDPTFRNPRGTHPPKKRWFPPPRTVTCNTVPCYTITALVPTQR